jgi:hypothetical protein
MSVGFYLWFIVAGMGLLFLMGLYLRYVFRRCHSDPHWVPFRRNNKPAPNLPDSYDHSKYTERLSGTVVAYKPHPQTPGIFILNIAHNGSITQHLIKTRDESTVRDFLGRKMIVVGPRGNTQPRSALAQRIIYTQPPKPSLETTRHGYAPSKAKPDSRREELIPPPMPLKRIRSIDRSGSSHKAKPRRRTRPLNSQDQDLVPRLPPGPD